MYSGNIGIPRLGRGLKRKQRDMDGVSQSRVQWRWGVLLDIKLAGGTNAAVSDLNFQ